MPRYSVTKRIDFCYGHRLLDHDGACKHAHGHNASVEVELRSETLDHHDMVCDFDELKRVAKAWIDEHLDHRMILRHDDPLVALLQRVGEPVFTTDRNPTVEWIARIIYDHLCSQGLPVVRVKVWETPTALPTYGDLTG